MRNSVGKGCRTRGIRGTALVLAAALSVYHLLGCSQKGLVRDRIAAERLPVVQPFRPDSLQPRFLVYGDNRPGWRVRQKFLDRSNWLTWKMALIPFYELYWFGNGVIGTFNWLRDAPDYGSREREQVRRAMLAYSGKEAVDFVINTGDIVTDGRYPCQWEQFIDEGTGDGAFLGRLRFVPVAGNHDDTNDTAYGAPNYQATMGYPRFYTLQFRNASLFVIDSNVILDQDAYLENDEQDQLFRRWIAAGPAGPPAWLEEQLAASDRPFRIVAMHHPPISFGKHHRDWNKPGYGRDLLDKRNELLDVLGRFRVQLLLSGHEHLYEHSVLLLDATPGEEPRQLHTLVSGGGGTPIRRESDEETLAEFSDNFQALGLRVQLEKHESIYHFCSLSVGPESIEVEVWQVPERGPGEPRLADSFRIDR